MNFFGHAVVATWRCSDAPFVLGSMLPDFANMVGARVPAVRHEVLERGVAFHHATDRVFHETETFRALQAEARRTLRDSGLPRAAALAVGHIGVEILLDGALARDRVGVDGYLRALSEEHASLGSHIVWNDDSVAVRYDALRRALSSRGVQPAAAEAEAVAFRVARALSPRPRLRLDASGERLVRSWAETAQAGVRAATPRLVEEMTRGLSQEGFGILPPAPSAFG